jgi:hypothetical protein
MTAVTPPGDEGLTFAAFAQVIGKSRPYVSKLVAQGVITARSLTADRRIIADRAQEDIAANADPARTRHLAPSQDSDVTYARQRARKTAAEAERAEIELQARKGELVERSIIATTLSPQVRELRDAILAAPRDTVLDPVQAADCEAALVAALTQFCGRLSAVSETVDHGGASAG